MSNDILFSVLAKDFSTSGPHTIREAPKHSNLTATNAKTGFVEWKVTFPDAGKYRLHVLMTAAESRPCALTINGTAQSGPILGETTGGWETNSLQWFVYGPYVFRQGENLLRIDFKKSQPHLKELGFSLAEEPQAAASGQQPSPPAAITAGARVTEEPAGAAAQGVPAEIPAASPTESATDRPGNLPPAQAFVHIVKIVGEGKILPGFSLLTDAKVLEGSAHAVLGIAALHLLGAATGPAAWLLLAANSYSRSVSDKHLHEHVKGLFK